MPLESNVTRITSGRKQRPSYPSDEAIQAQLDKILAYPAFERSDRLSGFLEYLVRRALSRDGQPVREVDLALDVFGKKASFDSRTDPIVRVEAGRLRKTIASYYASEGVDDPIQISLPSRGYTPKITFRRRSEGDDTSGPKQIRTSASGPSIAVLPFINMTNEPDQDIFCQGLTEELINALTAVDDFKVVSRTSAYQFKDVAVDLRKVGKELGVQTVIEGSVRVDGERLRVTAQLSSSGDGFHLWSQTFDATMSNVFEVQEDLARTIASHVSEQLRTAV